VSSRAGTGLPLESIGRQHQALRPARAHRPSPEIHLIGRTLAKRGYAGSARGADVGRAAAEVRDWGRIMSIRNSRLFLLSSSALMLFCSSGIAPSQTPATPPEAPPATATPQSPPATTPPQTPPATTTPQAPPAETPAPQTQQPAQPETQQPAQAATPPTRGPTCAPPH